MISVAVVLVASAIRDGCVDAFVPFEFNTLLNVPTCAVRLDPACPLRSEFRVLVSFETIADPERSSGDGLADPRRGDTISSDSSTTAGDSGSIDSPASFTGPSAGCGVMGMMSLFLMIAGLVGLRFTMARIKS